MVSSIVLSYVRKLKFNGSECNLVSLCLKGTAELNGSHS